MFFLRIEDTDKKREVEGGVQLILETFRNFGLPFDEGVTENGDKGKYGRTARASAQRSIMYLPSSSCSAAMHTRASAPRKSWQRCMHSRKPIRKTSAITASMRSTATAELEEIERRIAAGESYVVRFRSPGSIENKVRHTDLVKGKLELTENDQDIVLLKSDGIPTYHFAHVVDDHLMHTTHVVRGEEWLATLPVHLQLFDVLGWKRPKYVHTAQLMKMDGGSKRKLSKRKDPELALSYYYQQGIPVPSVMEYLMTLLNSNFEEWRRANQTAPLDDFPFSTKKMSVSGSLFDMDKLHDVSKNVISRMSAEDVYDSVAKWSADNDPEFHALFVRDPEMTKQFLAIGRGGKKPRKDLALWSETKAYMDFMFDELFQPDYSGMPERAKADAKAILTEYQDVYDAQDEMTVWFDKVKALAERHGFAPETKLYKKNPEQYKGPVGDISMVLRVAICGRTNAPDLYSVMQLMPTEKIKARLLLPAEAL